MAEWSEFMTWFVKFRHPLDVWENHATFLVAEYTFYFMAFLTLRHALNSGGRYPWMWISTIFHGLTVESLSYFMPDIDNFWHAQSTVVFLGGRLPLHIILFYPVLLYTAGAAVSRLHLRSYAEPFAMGLAVVLLDVPFDIMGIKLLWWTWHDTDPNIYDRHYWVPWTSYYFHATFACSFCFIFHNIHKLFSSKPKFHSAGFIIELLCAVITGLFSMPGGVLQFLPLYHPLHDNLHIHTEVCVLMVLTIYTLIVWTSDRNPSSQARDKSNRGWFDDIAVLVFLHFPLYIILSLVAKPEEVRSVGLHEEIGNCSARSDVHTAFGQVLVKNTYLCVEDYDEGYYDFHCVDKVPDSGSTWYTVCGTPYTNQPEYIAVVLAFSLLGLFVYLQILKNSGRQPNVGTQASPGKQALSGKQGASGKQPTTPKTSSSKKKK